MSASFYSLLFFFHSLFNNCHCETPFNDFLGNKSSYKVKNIGHLPICFNESSGLARVTDTTFWTMNDSGGDNKLFLFNIKTGQFIDTVFIDVPNIDWEDVVFQDSILYVGEFGNNRNIRKDLVVYKYLNNKVQSIKFSYQDQKEFPPAKQNMNFDCESFVWYNNALHLFSKNRGSKHVKRYILADSITDQPQMIQPVEKRYINGMVTAASLSPDKSLLALLVYGKIYLFKINQNGMMLDKPYKCINFIRGGQSEGITFINNYNMLVSNEKGRLYLVYKRKHRIY